MPTTVICKPKQAYARQDLGRWAALYGAQFSPNPGMSAVDGPRLLHAALAARSLGQGEEAARRLFRAMWAGDAPLATSADVAALLADLVGIPLRVVVGPQGLSQRQIELTWRGDTEARLVDAEGAADEIAKLVLARMEAGD